MKRTILVFICTILTFSVFNTFASTPEEELLSRKEQKLSFRKISRRFWILTSPSVRNWNTAALPWHFCQKMVENSIFLCYIFLRKGVLLWMKSFPI